MTHHKPPPPPVGSRAWLRWFRDQAPWHKLRTQVRREEPVCWLRLPGCTHTTTTADHIIPASVRPELALVRSNVRGACHNCNSKRKDKHAYDPALRRPTFGRAPTTATALRNHPRKPPRALAYFNGNG